MMYRKIDVIYTMLLAWLLYVVGVYVCPRACVCVCTLSLVSLMYTRTKCVYLLKYIDWWQQQQQKL